IATLNYITGFELRFDILYLLPVWLLAKPGYQRSALIMAVVVTALWTIVDFYNGHVYHHPYARYWNIAELLAAALIVASLGSRTRAVSEAPSPAPATARLDDSIAYAGGVMRRLNADGTPRKHSADELL